MQNYIKLVLLIVFIINLKISYSQNPFSYLQKIEVHDFKGVELYINESEAKIFNKKRKDLDKNNIFFTDQDCESIYMTLIAIVKIDNSTNKEYAITYSVCPEGEFTIYDANDPNIEYGSLLAEKLYITGYKSIYTSGNINNTFDVKRKFEILDNKLIEIKQPFYSVSMKGKTLNKIKLYQSKKLQYEIASLPKNYPIEIVLAEKSFNSTENIYLVKTKFGLIGWAKLRAGQYKPIDVDELMYNGD